jgi:predicted outer membrane repeat protein
MNTLTLSCNASPCPRPAGTILPRLAASVLFLSALAGIHADTPSLVINPGETKTLADLDAAGITDSNQIQFRGDVATDETNPARIIWDTRIPFPGNRSLIIGEYDGTGQPTASTTWTNSWAGGLIITAKEPVNAGTIYVGSGSRFTVSGGGTLRANNSLYLFTDAIADLTNAQFVAPIYNNGGNLTLHYTKDMDLRWTNNSGLFLIVTPPENRDLASATTVDVSGGVTATIRAGSLFNPPYAPNAVFTKTGAGTLDIGTNNPTTVSSDNLAAFNIDAGIVRINMANTLGVPLSSVVFRGDATAPDAAAPRIEIRDADITFNGSGISNSNRLVIGTWDADAHTPVWTASASGGFTIAEGKTLTLIGASGPAPEQGGAIAVGDGSRFVADGGGSIIFDANHARNGGALYAAPGSNVTLTNATFTNNTAINGNGGAIYNDRAHVTLNYTQDAAITNNTSSQINGGGFIYFNSDVTTSARLTFNIANGKQLTIGDATFASRDTINISSEGAATINKTGRGTVLVNSSVEFLEGTLNINEGTFLVRDLITTPTHHLAINLASGATLGGASSYPQTHGTGASAVAARGSRLQVGFAGDTAPARLMFDTLDLRAGGVVLDIDLFGSTPDSADHISARFIQFDPFNHTTPHLINLGGTLAEGTWMILDAGTLQGAGETNINELFTTQPLGRYLATFSLGETGTGNTSFYTHQVLLTLTANPSAATTLTWTGNTGNRWENSTLANWTGQTAGGQPANHFATGDRVLFDGSDTAGQRAIVVEEPQVTVSDILVTGSADYTFTGGGIVAQADAANPIIADATGKLIKSGTGTLTLNNGYSPTHRVTPNTFTGGIDLHGGTLAIARAEHLGAKLNQVRFLSLAGADAIMPARIAILGNDPTHSTCPDDIVFDATGTWDQRLTIGEYTTGKTQAWTAAHSGGFSIAAGKTVTIKNNSALTTDGINGGAIQVGDGSTFTVEGEGTLVLDSNKAEKGGALYAGRGSTVSLRNVKFTNNTVGNGQGDYAGAAIYSDAATLNLTYTRDMQHTGNISPAGYDSGDFLYMNGNAADGAAHTTINVTGNATVTIGAYISGSGGPDSIASSKEPDAHDYNTLVKTGSGVLVINSFSFGYRGHTSHEEGTLVVNGTLGFWSHTLDIASGATLKGTGRIHGSITLHAGATIAPGNSPGELTFENLVFEGGSTLQFETGDTITILGELSLANVTTDNKINIEFSALPAPGSTLISIAALATSSTFEDLGNAFAFTGPDGNALTPGLFSITQDGINFSISVAAVPEPETMALLLAAVAVGAVCLFRRNR